MPPTTRISGKHRRIVPLLRSKPRASGARAKVAAPQLTYGGGPLMTRVQVFTVFWGAEWTATARMTTLMKKLNTFFRAIVKSDVIDQLKEYDVPGQGIRRGSFIGTTVITANAPRNHIADRAIKQRLRTWIAAGVVPPTTRNTLYFIFLEPRKVAILGRDRSCRDLCGYHENTGPSYYAVMPYPSCWGCKAGLSDFDALTGTATHELCEAITDPTGHGWTARDGSEIGDLCDTYRTVRGYNVQREWSNARGKCY